MQTLQINATLQSGKYTIKKVLGQGGFGITYLAEHELLGTKVAIKEFFLARYCERDEYSSHVEVCSLSNVEEVKRYEEKFMKEARIIARLNHPNIVKIHDVFRENNTAYYVMDYLEGESLSAIVKKRGSLSEQEAVGYVQQVGKALAYIHEQHLNHLDVKPANIMIDSYGNAILIDFGGAKQYDIQSGEASTTTQVFSNGYAPIEQSNNGGVKKFSPATDIYALGATLYKLVTGVTPPPSNDVLNDGLPQFSASEPIVAAIYSAMQPRQNDRPQSVAEWVKLLDGKSAGYTQFNFSSSSSRNTNYQEDESTHVIKSAWQEEEENRQREQAERNSREQEENARKRQEEQERKHQEEIKRKQEEMVAKQRMALEQERLAQQRKEQELAKKKSSSKALYVGWAVSCIIAVVVSISIVISNNNSSASYSNYSTKQNTTQEQQTPQFVQKEEYTSSPKVTYYNSTLFSGDTGNASQSFVDLGLSVLWAPANFGAQNSYEQGLLFKWQEKMDEEQILSAGYPRGAFIPTKKEVLELRTKCKWKYKTVNNVPGNEVTGPNGNSIFLPAFFSNDWGGVWGYYWSSSKGSDNSHGYSFYFNKSSHDSNGINTRDSELCIRLVCTK